MPALKFNCSLAVYRFLSTEKSAHHPKIVRPLVGQTTPLLHVGANYTNHFFDIFLSLGAIAAYMAANVIFQNF